jgi:hypothetical protein
MRAVLFGLAQLASSAAALFGLYLLVGLPWALLVGGLTATVVFTALEVVTERRAGRRPAAPAPAPVSELEGLRSRKPEAEPLTRTAELED